MYDEAREKLLAEWNKLGCPTIITACPTCLSAPGADFGEPVGIWSALEDK